MISQAEDKLLQVAPWRQTVWYEKNIERFSMIQIGNMCMSCLGYLTLACCVCILMADDNISNHNETDPDQGKSNEDCSLQPIW